MASSRQTPNFLRSCSRAGITASVSQQPETSTLGHLDSTSDPGSPPTAAAAARSVALALPDPGCLVSSQTKYRGGAWPFPCTFHDLYAVEPAPCFHDRHVTTAANESAPSCTARDTSFVLSGSDKGAYAGVPSISRNTEASTDDATFLGDANRRQRSTSPHLSASSCAATTASGATPAWGSDGSCALSAGSPVTLWTTHCSNTVADL
mmetsp:Transcript_10871/g.43823  ORF Transcript_10871/g.43823 Transcript_10871/m.43823 type:complete len:207 (+) Transcript_10871:168-788(+)